MSSIKSTSRNHPTSSTGIPTARPGSKMAGGRAFRAAGLAAIAAFVLAGATLAHAADGDSGNKRALRLSSVEGQTQLTLDGQVIASPATDNLPIFEGSQLQTDNDGRAEIRLDDGGVVRISPNSTVTFTSLARRGSDLRTEIVVNSGLVYFELQPSTSSDSTRVSFNGITFTPSAFSVIRVKIDNPPGELAVFSGDVDAISGNAQVNVQGGQSLAFSADGDGQYNLSQNIAQDSWDAWNADEDQALNSEKQDQTAASTQIANGSAVDSSQLDAYGNWYNIPGQGSVWSPYEAIAGGASWDPYGYGNWVDYPGYGYIFASGYPWGYAPYACGNWNFYGGFGWGWAPGGGCNPWWGNGGWGYNMGYAPGWYHPPARPMPIGPGGSGGPIRLHPGGVINTVIPVGHPPLGITGHSTLLATGHPDVPINVNGRTVDPVHPITARPGYASVFPREALRPGYEGTFASAHPTFLPNGGNAGFGYSNGRSSYAGGSFSSFGIRPSVPGGAYGGRPSANFGGGNMPRSSFGGGGGGGFHSSFGGGGGGGGGGFHMSGGGGGGGAAHAGGGAHR